MNKSRIIIGVVGFAFVIAVILMGNLTLGVVLSAVMLIALTEMYKTLGLLKKDKVSAVLGYLFCAGFLIFNIYGIFYNTLSYSSFAFKFMPSIIMYIIALGVYTVLFFDRVDLPLITVSFFTTVYITVMFSHILLVRQLSAGSALVWVVLLSAWSTDTFAYFAGRHFGKRPLIPNVSAKKTVEGAVGGVIGCLVVLLIFGAGCSMLGYNVNYVYLVILALASSVIAQFGDLIASCIKRYYHTKDYGHILPGHGGILDRFDSVLTVAPMVYYVCQLLPVITK